MPNLEQELSRLGLNESQSKIYLYILENKRINLKGTAELLDVSSAGASKMLSEMVGKGFLKKMKIENKKIYLPRDLNEVLKQMQEKKRKEVDDMEQTLAELKSRYGSYSIKVYRLGDNYIDKIKGMVVQAKKAFEFVDLRNIVTKPELPKEYDEVEFKTIFSGNAEVPHGTNIDLETGKKYAHIVAFDKNVALTTTNKETIIIKNEEVANSVMAIIEKFK